VEVPDCHTSVVELPLGVHGDHIEGHVYQEDMFKTWDLNNNNRNSRTYTYLLVQDIFLLYTLVVPGDHTAEVGHDNHNDRNFRDRDNLLLLLLHLLLGSYLEDNPVVVHDSRLVCNRPDDNLHVLLLLAPLLGHV
jgi:hypothetical protein